MDKRFLSILAVIVIIFIGIFAFSQHNSNKGSTGSSNASQATSHISGKGQTGVTLMEYGDYECPVCGAYYPAVKQATDQLSNEAFFQFRNLPLIQIHHTAFAAARAAEAAGLQGKYFEMHDILYQENVKYNSALAQNKSYSTWIENPNPLNYFVQYAQQLGLDINKFKSDYNSSQVNNAINADLAAFNKTGQEEATPSFFIDGKFIPLENLRDPSTNQPSVDKFTKAINDAIAAKNH